MATNPPPHGTQFIARDRHTGRLKTFPKSISDEEAMSLCREWKALPPGDSSGPGTAWWWAATECRLDMMHWLYTRYGDAGINRVSKGGQTPPLYQAIVRCDPAGRDAAVKWLLAHGADASHVNRSSGVSMFCMACGNLSTDFVLRLLEEGFVPREHLDLPSDRGLTPVKNAFMAGKLETVERLILMGADVRAIASIGAAIGGGIAKQSSVGALVLSPTTAATTATTATTT